MMATTYTKKFKEFIQEWNPENTDYIVGYRALDDSEIRIPLLAVDNSITANKYIRKDIDDYANGIIRFNKGLIVDDNIMSTIYLQGLNGWYGNSKGDFEMNSLILREFLEVPELRKNKITVMGNQFWFTDSAMVMNVSNLGNSDYEIYFKLEDEEYAPFELDDILKGIYHYSNGFYTVYLKVYELILDPDTQGEIGVRVHSLNSKDPRKSMLLARMNNSSDPERQGSIFADGLKRYIRVLYGYDEEDPTSEGSLDTLKLQMGDLSGIKNHPIFGDLEGYGLYADNVYLTGKLIVKNDPDQPGQQLGVYRGAWDSKFKYYIYDQVTYKGSLYTSKQINNLGNIPSGGPDDLWWELTVAKGDDGSSGVPNVTIELTNDNHTIPTDSNGANPSYGGAYSTAYIYEGSNDITHLYTIVATLEFPKDPSKLQFVQNDNTVTITYIADDIDSANIKFTATCEGYPTVSKTWSITKSKSGKPGEDATAYWLVTDSPVIKKLVYNIDGVETVRYEPNPFVIRAFSQTGTKDILPYDGFLRLTYGGNTKVVSGSVYQFSPEADVQSYTIELFQDSGLVTLLDKEIVTVVSDGTMPNWQIYIFKASDTIPDIPNYVTPPTSYPTEEGWMDYPNDSTSIWWMSTAAVNGVTNQVYNWSKPVKVTGEDGQDGKDGVWVDFKFAKNTDPNIAPDIVVTERYPEGWSDTTPTISSGEYLWMTNATINPDDTLKTNWSKPVRISGEQGPEGPQGPQGPQGLHGEDGLQGPSIVFAGEWSKDTQYYAYADTQTCVYYNGKYYYTKTVSPELSPLKIPAGEVNNPSSDTGKIYWNEFVGQFDNIATGLLLAERIATAELAANKIFIVDREESSGNIIAADGSIITKEEEKNMDPNEIIGRLTKGWYMDQGVIRSIAVDDELKPILKLDENGVITATGVNITGTVHFQNGTIGSMTVYGDDGWQSSVNGPYPASSGFYYLRKEKGVTITPEGHIIGKDYFLTGDSSVGPSVFIGDVYVPGSSVPGTDDNSLTAFLKLFNTLFERVLIDGQYVIKAKLPFFSVGEITAYGSDGMSIPSIWEGIPVDKVTIDLIDGKLTVIGGTGGGGIDESQLWSILSDNGNEQISKSHLTTALSGYATESWVTNKGYLTSITKAMVEAVLTGDIQTHTHSQYLTTHQNIYALTVKGDTTTAITFNPKSAAATLTIASGSNISVNVDSANKKITIANTYSYTHPTATATTISAATGKVLSAITVNNLGHVTSVSAKTLAAGDIPTLSISKISGLQTALDSKLDESVFTDMFEKVVQDGETFIKAKYNFYSVGEVSAGGAGTSGGGSTGGIDEAQLWAILGNTGNEQIAKNHLTTALSGYATEAWVTGKDYATQAWVEGKGYLTSYTNNYLTGVSGSGNSTVTFTRAGLTSLTWNAYHAHTFASLTDKPTTLAGYGITDGVNAVSVTGSGNAITAASVSGHTLTLTKGSTFLLSSAYTAADILAKLKTVDGSGSGLDADLLDGLDKYDFLKTGTRIGAVDWNTLKENYIHDTWLDKWGTNTPADTYKYGQLVVLKGYTSVVQMYIPHTNTEGIRFRITWDGTDAQWGNWKRLALTTDNVASATKLQTPRTIWGKSFDGTANVSGNLSEVDQIKFTDTDNMINPTSDGIMFMTLSGAAKGIKVRSLLVATGYSSNVNDGCITASSIITANGGFSTPQYIQIGSGRIYWDATNNALYVKKSDGTACNFYSLGEIAAGGAGTGSGGTGGGIDEEQLWAILGNTGTEQIAKNHLTSALAGYLTSVSLSTIKDLHANWDAVLKVAPTSYVTRWPTFAEVTSKPTTLSGYGITDAYTKTESDNKYRIIQKKSISQFTSSGSWYRIAQSSATNTSLNYGKFYITDKNTGSPFVIKIDASISYNNSPIINAYYYSAWQLKVTKARIVYASPYTTQRAYLEIYINNNSIYWYNVDFEGYGWELITPIATTEEYTENLNAKKEISLIGGATNYSTNFLINGNTVLHTGNYTTTLDTRYVKKDGDTMTGSLSISSSSYGQLNLNRTSSTCAIRFSSADTLLGAIGFNVKDKPMFITADGQERTIWHAGNDGSGSGLDADLLDGVQGYQFFQQGGSVASDTNLNTYMQNKAYSMVGSTPPNSPSNTYNYGTLLVFDTGGSSSIGGSITQIYFPHSSSYCPRYRTTYGRSETRFHEWVALARITDNVASATKLQTPRTIWGQNFDGTANISGALTGVSTISMSSNLKSYGSNGGFALYSGSNKETALRIDSVSSSGDWLRNCLTLYHNGNFGIDTVTPSYKLHVNGSVGVVGAFNGYGGQFRFGSNSATDTTYSKYHRLDLGYHSIDHCDFYEKEFNFYTNGGSTQWAKIAETNYFTGNVGIGTTSPSYKLHVNGTLGVTGVTTLNGVNLNSSILVPYSPGSWISMATRGDCIRSGTNNSASSAHALYRIKDSSGNAICFGGLGSEVGFNGFLASNISSGANVRTWYTTWNVCTGNLYHSKGMNVMGDVSFSSGFLVVGTSTFTGKTTHNGGLQSTTGTFTRAITVSGESTFSALLHVNGGAHTPNNKYFSTFNTSGTYCSMLGIDGNNYGFVGTIEKMAGMVFKTYDLFLFNFNGSANYVTINKSGIACKGEVAAGSTSDIRLKNVLATPDYQKRLLDLGNVVDYEYNNEAFQRNTRTIEHRRYTGLIYQNVVSVLPQMAGKDDDGYGYLNYIHTDYINLIAGALQQTIKKQETIEERINRLEKENEELKRQLKRYYHDK